MAKKEATHANGGFTSHFVVERETKGAIRYMEVTAPGNTQPFTIGEGAKIGSLYIRKEAFAGGEAPKSITVVVS